MRRLPRIALTLLILTVLTAGCATTGPGTTAHVPLPPALHLSPPAPGTPPEFAAFSGKWEGLWDGGPAHILVVEEIRGNEAIVVYAWGASEGFFGPGFNRYRGVFNNGTLVIKLPRPATATYRMRPDGTLDGTYEWSGGITRTILKKAE